MNTQGPSKTHPSSTGNSRESSQTSATLSGSAAPKSANHQNDQHDQEPHPILRHSGQAHLHAQGSHVKFDEEAIREHDKLRGTRQKIDEAKTPYVRDGENATGGVRLDLGALNAELEKEKEKGTLPKAAQRTKQTAFEEMRRKHYNEMDMVRKFKEMGGTSDEDDENE